MKPRIEIKIRDDIVMQIMCKPDISDGDLATMIEDAAQDLRWNVMKMTETHYTRPEGANHAK